MNTDTNCSVGFCANHERINYNGKSAVSHLVKLPGGSEYEVITDDATGKIVYDNRPWQYQG